MFTAFLRSVLAEPRAPQPPARAWWDWVLVGALLVTAAGEAVLRPDLEMRPLAAAVALLVIPVLLWRRTHPLPATAVGFGGAMVLLLPTILGDADEVGLNTMAAVLLLPYALYRWASGPEALVGTAVVAVPAGLGLAASGSLGDVVGGTTVLVASFALGAAMRYRAVARQREVQQVRTLERGELARELHDTVAHHVSAIAIQAQAGRAVAATDPASAVEALAVIEAEASRTLYEMRTMVRVLRAVDGGDGGPADYAPQRGVGDLDELGRMSPTVRVHRAGDLDGLPQPVDTAVYRICQESVTNAIRHALNATAVTVEVTGDVGVVRLRVHDDGEAARPTTPMGYGLLGMAERAKLLGGTFEAGPDPAGGWTVDATLPRDVPR
ncbi:histidine kinase [Aeromicrobium marinum DSM 15272]|uniref:histidine kinase n=1 Tax=Aeromicrobium marinum DSM 15272 TaxID=585531 RepID=E2SCE1_9ACTN|nr:histidine kinase [Aeromicrobium marinum]EFQ82894.1 histidine kinase [Aeromicrobium marinum DSM 15272]